MPSNEICYSSHLSSHLNRTWYTVTQQVFICSESHACQSIPTRLFTQTVVSLLTLFFLTLFLYFNLLVVYSDETSRMVLFGWNENVEIFTARTSVFIGNVSSKNYVPSAFITSFLREERGKISYNGWCSNFSFYFLKFLLFYISLVSHPSANNIIFVHFRSSLLH